MNCGVKYYFKLLVKFRALVLNLWHRISINIFITLKPKLNPWPTVINIFYFGKKKSSAIKLICCLKFPLAETRCYRLYAIFVVPSINFTPANQRCCDIWLPRYHWKIISQSQVCGYYIQYRDRYNKFV